jgi:serine/threonine protein kinase
MLLWRTSGRQSKPHHQSTQRLDLSTHWLPSEVNGGRYDAKIDIWSFGLACFHTIFPPSVFERVQSLKQHTALMDTITEYASRGQHHALFAHLLKQLLAWSAYQRPSATQALAHPFFALCPAQPEPVPPRHAGSSHDADRPSKIVNTTPQEQEVSPPASPARQGAENVATKQQRGLSCARGSQLSLTHENTPL